MLLDLAFWWRRASAQPSAGAGSQPPGRRRRIPVFINMGPMTSMPALWDEDDDESVWMW